jgi:hypothetical protein
LAFSLSANSLLTAAPITPALMLYCSRLRQEPCCPPGPNPPAEERFQKNTLKARLARLAPYSSSAGSSSSPTDSLILFLFVLSDGRPDDHYGFGDYVRTFVEKMLWWPSVFMRGKRGKRPSYFLLLTTQQRIVTFGPSQDCAASRQHFDGAFTCIRFIFFVVRCNQSVDFRGQTESVSGIDFSLFRINNLQNLLF